MPRDPATRPIGSRHGLLFEVALSAAYSAPAATPTPSPPRRGAPSAAAPLRRRRLGSDYDLWRARLAWSSSTRVPFTATWCCATAPLRRVGHGSLARLDPVLAGRQSARPTCWPSHLLQSFSAVGPAARLPGRAFRRQRDLLRQRRAALPDLRARAGHSTWPILLRPHRRRGLRGLRRGLRQGTERGYAGPDFHWERLRSGLAPSCGWRRRWPIWLLADIRLGWPVARQARLGGVGADRGPVRHLAVVRDPGAGRSRVDLAGRPGVCGGW